MEQARLLGTIYQAALDPDGLPAAVKAIVAYVGADAGTLFSVSKAASVVHVETLSVTASSEGDFGEGQAHNDGLDPRLIWADANLGVGEVSADDCETALQPMEHSAAQRSYFGRFRPGACLCACVFQDASRQGFLSIHRGCGANGFDSDELMRFRTVVPHLVEAVHLHRTIAAERQVAAGLVLALDHSPAATLVANSAGKVLHANRTALDLLAGEGPLRLRDGQVIPADQRDVSAWLRVLRQSINGNAAEAGLPPILRIADRHEGTGAWLMVAGGADRDGSRGNAPVVIFAAAAGCRLRTDPALLQHQFGLTRAEAEIAASLAAGDAPEGIALQRGRTPSTVRAQIKIIYQKLEVSTQSQLVSLLSGSLAVLSRASERQRLPRERQTRMVRPTDRMTHSNACEPVAAGMRGGAAGGRARRRLAGATAAGR